jgi:hypothetical protein
MIELYLHFPIYLHGIALNYRDDCTLKLERRLLCGKKE